ncbi:MAG: hypothetical protein ACE5R4_18040, partial [Armatimonadota bacterium]
MHVTLGRCVALAAGLVVAAYAAPVTPQPAGGVGDMPVTTYWVDPLVKLLPDGVPEEVEGR